MAVRNCWGEVMAFLRQGAGVTELPVTDGGQYGAAMKQTCPLEVRDAVQ